MRALLESCSGCLPVSPSGRNIWTAPIHRLCLRASSGFRHWIWNDGGTDLLKTGSGRRRGSSKQRQGLLAHFHQSQLTQHDFATRHGAGLSTLSKCSRLECEAVPAKVKFQEVWLPGPTSHWPVEFVSPQGWTVRRQIGLDMMRLPELLRQPAQIGHSRTSWRKLTSVTKSPIGLLQAEGLRLSVQPGAHRSLYILPGNWTNSGFTISTRNGRPAGTRARQRPCFTCKWSFLWQSANEVTRRGSQPNAPR